MSTDENRQIIIDYWFKKSCESLQSAKRDLEAHSPNFAMNRIYYSAFYAVSAVLMRKGLTFKKHSGVRSTFHLSIIKEGLIDSEWGKFYDRFLKTGRKATMWHLSILTLNMCNSNTKNVKTSFHY